MASNLFSCPDCGATWGGFNVSHCCSCHETFTAASSFDLHQRASNERPWFQCLDPATVTSKAGKPLLVRNTRGHWRSSDHRPVRPIWVSP